MGCSLVSHDAGRECIPLIQTSGDLGIETSYSCFSPLMTTLSHWLLVNSLILYWYIRTFFKWLLDIVNWVLLINYYCLLITTYYGFCIVFAILLFPSLDLELRFWWFQIRITWPLGCSLVMLWINYPERSQGRRDWYSFASGAVDYHSPSLW